MEELLPWEGEDELVEVKEAALQAQHEELQKGAVRKPVGNQEKDVQGAMEALPTLRAFVTSMGGVNPAKVLADLEASGHIVYRLGQYVQNVRKAGKAQLFVSEKTNGKRELFVTDAGKVLLEELKENGTLTKEKSGEPSDEERVQRAAYTRKLREKRAQRRLQKKLDLEARQPQVLADLDAKIEASIARRAQTKERLAAASKAAMVRYYESLNKE
ncbi:hypothetical protein QCE47_02765 [Caballeronia sp. LZ025]|uniref:hypothetical protein n=2 Tax=Caballeronia TaxID=1827195 RepID=UPI001FD4C359|nr:hypothetical protein [Caballeronia grimmiae]MDR5731272.1 hypothetical protein [Caballeronia sp. LZ025]